MPEENHIFAKTFSEIMKYPKWSGIPTETIREQLVKINNAKKQAKTIEEIEDLENLEDKIKNEIRKEHPLDEAR